MPSSKRDQQRSDEANMTSRRSERNRRPGGEEALRASPTMARLLDALGEGTDIGHYGRLTFVMVARHFLSDEQMLSLLRRQPDHNERDMAALIEQAEERGYNPPRRERILEWQARQDFPIIANPDDPAEGNLYRELDFPDDIYEHIEQYHEGRAEAGGLGDRGA